MRTARAILATARPHQWVKNLFVVAPLVFSKHLFMVDYVARTLIATAAFCAVSAAVYTFNDLRDAEADRAHPIKCRRPIASGELEENLAIAATAAWAAAAITVSLALSWEVLAATAGYLAVNLCYSLGLKRVAFVDVMAIAGGFLLRVLAGAYAIAVPVSPWLLACTGLLASLLGFGKRAHELLLANRAGRQAAATRAALAGYHLGLLRVLLLVLALATCVAYALYTRDARTVAFFGTESLAFTLPFCVAGIGRFLWLTLIRPRDTSPTEAMLRDWPFLLNLAVWAATVVAIVYGT